MFKIRKILAPVDFSELSEAAAKHAGALARQFDSTLIFAHVYFPQVFTYYGGTEGGAYVAQVQPPPEEVLADARRRLKHLAAKISADRAVEQVVLEGDPAGQIVAYAQQHQMDLIVMPTRGYGPFRRFILGSVTAKVLHDSDCPIFTGAHGADLALNEPQAYRRVACAVDLGPHSENVLRWAAGFAAACGAKLALIHAASLIRMSGPGPGAEFRGALLEGASEEIRQLLQKVGCQAEVHAESADVTEYVAQVAASIEADLLVIGRTSKEGFLGRLRANTYALIRESPCPVVSV
jgi:nucleotide-binding universal stress UspA family protein